MLSRYHCALQQVQQFLASEIVCLQPADLQVSDNRLLLCLSVCLCACLTCCLAVSVLFVHVESVVQCKV